MKRQDIHQHIHYWLLMAIVFTMPFPGKLNNWCIIACLLNHIVEGRLLHQLKSAWSNTINRYLILFYALHLFSLLFSSDLTEAIAILERRLVLLIFPLILFKPIEEKQYKMIVYAFTAGVVIALVYCIGMSAYRYTVTGQTAVFFYHTLAEPIDINAIYLSAYAVFAVFLLSQVIMHTGTTTKKILILIIVFLVVGVLLLSSKMMLVILCLGLCYLLLSNYNWITTPKLAFIAIVLILGATTFTIPQIRERFSLEFSSNFNVVQQTSYRYDTPFTGTTLRLTIWKYCYIIWQRENAWLTGVGTGDFQQLLNEEYKSVNMYTGNPELNDTGYLGYGPHNQYIETVFVFGLIGLLIFILLLLKQLLKAIHSGNRVFVLFIVLHLFFFTSESALSTNKGIVFYAYFSLIFNARATFLQKDMSIR